MWDSAFLDVWDPAICSYLLEDVWWAGPCPTLPSVRPWLLWGFAFCETLPSVRNPDFVYLCFILWCPAFCETLPLFSGRDPVFCEALPLCEILPSLMCETLPSALIYLKMFDGRKPIHLKMFWPSRNRRPLLSWFSSENHMWWICPQALYEPEPLTLQTRAGYHPSALTEKFEPQFSQTVKFSNCHVFMSLVLLSYFFHYLPLFSLISHVFSYF